MCSVLAGSEIGRLLKHEKENSNGASITKSKDLILNHVFNKLKVPT
jgi:hypothetical protein